MYSGEALRLPNSGFVARLSSGSRGRFTVNHSIMLNVPFLLCPFKLTSLFAYVLILPFYHVLVTSRISVMISDGPGMEKNQIYCGLSPYIGVKIYLDQDEISTDNNIIWKKVRFVCSDVYGTLFLHVTEI